MEHGRPAEYAYSILKTEPQGNVKAMWVYICMYNDNTAVCLRTV